MWIRSPPTALEHDPPVPCEPLGGPCHGLARGRTEASSPQPFQHELMM